VNCTEQERKKERKKEISGVSIVQFASCRDVTSRDAYPGKMAA
jgi:hypothetical protein